MRGAIPPLPNTSSWRGAQLKKAQGQLYLHLSHINKAIKDEMGGACSTHGGDEKCLKYFSWKI
jgi:hypothetical protein